MRTALVSYASEEAHALRQFRQVLSHVRATEGDSSPTALDLRRNVGILLLSEGRLGEALAELHPLYDDLRMTYGPESDASQEVGDVLSRIRIAGA